MSPYFTGGVLIIAGKLNRLAVAANDNDINLYRSTRAFSRASAFFRKPLRALRLVAPGLVVSDKLDRPSDGSR